MTITSMDSDPSIPKDQPLTPSQTQAIETHLADLSLQILQTLTVCHDYTSPLLKQHLTPDFTSTHSAFPPVYTRQAWIEQHKSISAQIPDIRSEILDCSTTLQCGGKRAVVWLTVGVKGLPPGDLERETVCALFWRWSLGKGWVCWKHGGLESCPVE